MKTNYLSIVVCALVMTCSVVTCWAQESSPSDTLFRGISSDQTNEQRQKILDKIDVEVVARAQYKQGVKYIAVAGYAVTCPGVDRNHVSFDQKIIAPMTGCTPSGEMSLEQHGQWTSLVRNFALRYNLVMRHLAVEQNIKLKQPVSLDETRAYFRIPEKVFEKISLESKLLMQHTIVDLINEKHQRIELEDKLAEHGIWETLEPANKE